MNDASSPDNLAAQPFDTATWAAALDDSALRRASSSAIFQRGKTYAGSGAVDVTEEERGDSPSIRATITGTSPYATEVWIEDGEVGGDCDCPNAEDGWFCKHQVALALVWRERLSGQAPTLDEESRKKVQASVKRAQTLKDRRQALADFLHSQPVAVLADRLLGLADRDHEIGRELQQWRKLSDAPDKASNLKALVTEIMAPGRDFISWDESHAYARRAEAVLPLLAQTRERDPSGAAALCLHAMRRGWAVLMQADDSNGDVGGLIQDIGAEWVRALSGAGPQPAAFGEAYLQLRLDDPFGCFDTAAAEAAMGTPALARYRKALATRWRETKDAVLAVRAEHAAQVAQANANRKRPPPFDPQRESDMRLWALERMHLDRLEADGDIDGALAVMREGMTREGMTAPGDYHRVTVFLERHGRLRDAFANAELGCKLHPGESWLEDDLLRCYERDGWVEEAFVLRRHRFGRSPGVDRYHETLKAGAAAARDAEALRAELQQVLVADEEREMGRSAAHGGRFFPGRIGARAEQRNVSLRAEVLCSEGRWDEALALVQPPAWCRNSVLTHLARRLGPQQSAQRIELLMRVFAAEMSDSKSPYRQELELVEEIAGLLDATRRVQWLLELRREYKAKRNFVRDLPPA
ncbi:SWIM zinc finger domain-containing protein [Rhizobacter sp. OV335]|uniref:SWIM zinc finger family protein n=1 Tax=Rhizobacter sp. OV335 TaxID=1500264 RepID=UPI00091C536C|nr:SWIM zinc finger family protein [Rhizobacter sp. OV335]SHN28940.1 SWIM zinc finger [Rhizobacter sp. OV335]